MKILYKILLALMLPLAILGSERAQAQGVEQKSISTSDRKMSAYPIPANTAVFIRLSPALKTEAKTVELVNLIGRTVATQNVNNYEGSDIVFGGLNQIPEGVYIGVTRNADGKILQTTKLVIQH